MFLYIALLVPLLIVILYRPILRLITPRGLPDIPAYPDPSPILGDVSRVAKFMKAGTFSKFFEQCAKDLGPIAQVRLGLFETMVLLSDYQTCENVLTQQTRFHDRADTVIKMFSNILPTGQIALKTNEMWKHHRRIIAPAMTSKYLSLTTPRANESIGNLVELWRAKSDAAGGRAWAAGNDMESSTMDAMCGMAFGSSWGIIRAFTDQVIGNHEEVPTGKMGDALFVGRPPPLAESTLVAFESVSATTAVFRLKHLATRLSPKHRYHRGRINKFLDAKLASSRIKAKQMGRDLAVELADNTLDLMVAREFRADDWMPDNEMKDELLQYLVAGTETSGVTLSWWLKYMTNHPETQRKLRDHLISRVPHIQDRPPSFEDLNATSTPYLEAIVHETLRLSRTAGGYMRQVTEDMVILGKRLPKGTTIVFSTLLGHEDRSTPIFAVPEYASESSSVQDPKSAVAVQLSNSLAKARTVGSERKVGYWAAGSGKKFDPDRWLDAEGRFDLTAGPSLPFSLGQRGCFGKNLAILELRLFMSQLNQAFFFARVSEEQNSFDSYETIATHPRQCFVRPVPWDSMEAMA